MNHKVSANKVAALANVKSYDRNKTRKYIDGAPHIKHAKLRALYGGLVAQVYDTARSLVCQPRVLDLGAGEGSATLPFLELGARVTAVDISESQLDVLRTRCSSFADNLTVYCGDIDDAIGEFLEKSCQYDIVVANSFLHHVPDYLGLIKRCPQLLSRHGQFFSFEDPMAYASLGRLSHLLTQIAYLSWRVFKGDVIGGIQRRVRRSRGIYYDDCPQDNAEYHVVRGGVDQNAIAELFKESGFECQIIPYFATQSRFWQPIGSSIKANNMFSIVARKKSSEG
jgi:SAM-dependent methyltransferase